MPRWCHLPSVGSKMTVWGGHSCVTAFHGFPPHLNQTPPWGPMLFKPGFMCPFSLAILVPRKHHARSPSSLWAPSSCPPCPGHCSHHASQMKRKPKFGCCLLQEVCLDNNQVWVCQGVPTRVLSQRWSHLEGQLPCDRFWSHAVAAGDLTITTLSQAPSPGPGRGQLPDHNWVE